MALKGILCTQCADGGWVQTSTVDISSFQEELRLRASAHGVEVYDRPGSLGGRLFDAPVLLPGWDNHVLRGEVYFLAQGKKALSAKALRETYVRVYEELDPKLRGGDKPKKGKRGKKAAAAAVEPPEAFEVDARDEEDGDDDEDDDDDDDEGDDDDDEDDDGDDHDDDDDVGLVDDVEPVDEEVEAEGGETVEE